MNEKIPNPENTPLSLLEQNHPEIFDLISDSLNLNAEIELNDSGQLVCKDGDVYEDSPKTREMVKIASAIIDKLPAVPEGHVRLWRGNRVGEVGLNPSYTKSLAGIALPFLLGYKGPLSYIDVPTEKLATYQTSGAEDAEFILPPDLTKSASIVGLTDEQTDTLKSQSKPEERIPESEGWDRISL